MAAPKMTAEIADHFATIALGHVTREYPHKVDHVMNSVDDVYRPRTVHPIFYGSFDWHSCVHGYWLLARLRRLYPELPQATAINNLFDSQFAQDKVEAERAYLDRPSNSSFERPYGWAWLLMLAAELRRDDSESARRWSVILEPLRDLIVSRFYTFLPKLTYAIRAGAHSNTAFALVLASEYAIMFADERMYTLLAVRAEAWFGRDQDASASEPSGDDFLSPTLIEAEAMRRLLPGPHFMQWFDDLLPGLKHRRPASLLSPAHVSDRNDGKIGHLDGLNLSRAWCWRSLVLALPEVDERRPILLEAADLHFAAAVDHVTGNYAGEHWLASFALLALTV